MTSVQRKFAASLITLLITLSLSYAGQTTKLTPDVCDENRPLATTIRRCLAAEGIIPTKLCATAPGSIEAPGRIEVALSGDKDEPVDCKVINAIRKCTLVAVSYQRGYDLYLSIAPSAGGAPAQFLYGHTGTEHDADTMPKCIDVLALKSVGTLKIKTGRVESKVREDAKRLGVRIDDLDVKVKKREGDKLRLEVSGMVREAKVSEEQVKEIVTDLVSKYTGVHVLAININELNTDRLKAPITKR